LCHHTTSPATPHPCHYTTLFRSEKPYGWIEIQKSTANSSVSDGNGNYSLKGAQYGIYQGNNLVETLTTDEKGYAKSGDLEVDSRSEEHTSELQSRFDLVCRLLLV